MFEDKPKIIIEPTPTDRLLDKIGIGMLGLLWVLVLYMIATLPKFIPSHFDFQGNINRHAPTVSLLFIPAIITGLHILLNIISKSPHVFNYPVRITPENAERQYKNSLQLMRVMVISLSLVFSFILVEILLVTRGVIQKIGIGDIFLMVGIVLIPTFYFLYKSLKMK